MKNVRPVLNVSVLWVDFFFRVHEKHEHSSKQNISCILTAAQTNTGIKKSCHHWQLSSGVAAIVREKTISQLKWATYFQRFCVQWVRFLVFLWIKYSQRPIFFSVCMCVCLYVFRYLLSLQIHPLYISFLFYYGIDVNELEDARTSGNQLLIASVQWKTKQERKYSVFNGMLSRAYNFIRITTSKHGYNEYA